MRIYCFCKAKLMLKEGHPAGVVLSEHPMEIEEIGVPQFLRFAAQDTPEDVKKFQHYPSVDIRTCRNCGARVILEG